MSFLYSVVGFLIAIGVLVAVHEFGHFWVARKLGVKVLRYSVGFGKPIWKKIHGEDQIEYVIGAIPLGGYVKMLGEGAGGESVKPEEAHRAFDNQPIWKRSLIVAAGPGINFLFAILLFMLLGMVTEPRVIPTFGDLSESSILAEAGVLAGDDLIAVDGRPAEYLLQHDLYIFNQVLKGQDVDLEIARRGSSRTITVQTSEIPIYNINPSSLMYRLGFVRVRPPSTTELAYVESDTPAAQAGLLAGDKVLSIDGQKTQTWQDLVAIVGPAANRKLDIVVDRQGLKVAIQATPAGVQVNDQEIGRLGVARVVTPMREDQLVSISRSPLEALHHGIEKTWLMSSLTIRMLWKMVTLQVSHKNVNGPITIADVAGQAIQISWQTYLQVLAVISISLGVMNLLPIPMLDGGHLLMYVVEVIAGQSVAEKAFAVGQRLGVLLLICLMSLAFYNDIFRLLN